MKLKNIINEESTIHDKDMKTFKKIHPELEQLLDNIERLWDKLESQMSDFNSPGAQNAFKKAIKATLGSISGRPRSKPGKEELKQYMRDN